jgi:hypothetical protein
VAWRNYCQSLNKNSTIHSLLKLEEFEMGTNFTGANQCLSLVKLFVPAIASIIISGVVFTPQVILSALAQK